MAEVLFLADADAWFYFHNRKSLLHGDDFTAALKLRREFAGRNGNF
jgi:hypothetical protein